MFWNISNVLDASKTVFPNIANFWMFWNVLWNALFRRALWIVCAAAVRSPAARALTTQTIFLLSLFRSFDQARLRPCLSLSSTKWGTVLSSRSQSVRHCTDQREWHWVTCIRQPLKRRLGDEKERSTPLLLATATLTNTHKTHLG